MQQCPNDSHPLWLIHALLQDCSSWSCHQQRHPYLPLTLWNPQLEMPSSMHLLSQPLGEPLQILRHLRDAGPVPWPKYMGTANHTYREKSTSYQSFARTNLDRHFLLTSHFYRWMLSSHLSRDSNCTLCTGKSAYSTKNGPARARLYGSEPLPTSSESEGSVGKVRSRTKLRSVQKGLISPSTSTGFWSPELQSYGTRTSGLRA
ncbi:hypothetical protein BKA70DRAFT_638309 [Coprinopsis sp. MPI-PUGE-AT-0042]|nr:hypothetical protein BKA70DRAFT_638309 [Coprinopsis sp. MPI-PUGE-AT-0042]